MQHITVENPMTCIIVPFAISFFLLEGVVILLAFFFQRYHSFYSTLGSVAMGRLLGLLNRGVWRLLLLPEEWQRNLGLS